MSHASSKKLSIRDNSFSEDELDELEEDEEFEYEDEEDIDPISPQERKPMQGTMADSEFMRATGDIGQNTGINQQIRPPSAQGSINMRASTERMIETVDPTKGKVDYIGKFYKKEDEKL